MLKRYRQRGFTLIELLIVVAIIGIIAAILIPNLLDALQKAKQKRTISDVRNAGTAWMSWLTDQVGAASAGQTGGGSSTAVTFKGSAHTVDVTHAMLFKYLHPSDTFFYMQKVPELDGWNWPLQFAMSPNLLWSSTMSIYAACRDTAFTQTGGAGNDFLVYGFLSTDYDQDIVWADGYFVRWPEGTKR